MRVLITRPLEDAARTAAALVSAGHEPIIAPIVRIEPLAHEMPWPVDALLATSANALRHAAIQDQHRGLPVFTVGDATASEARSCGFKTVHSAQGDSRDLAALVRRQLPARAKLGYLAGRLRRDGALIALQDDFSLLTCETYEVVALTKLPAIAREALGQGTIDAVLHFSQNAALTFARLVEQAELVSESERIIHIFIAPSSALIHLHNRLIARQPTLAGLIEALQDAQK